MVSEPTEAASGWWILLHCPQPGRVRPLGIRRAAASTGRAGHARAGAGHAGNCGPGALRLWDVSRRRAGSSFPALLSGPPPPPSASSSLSFARSRAPLPPPVGLFVGYCRGFRAESEEEAPVPCAPSATLLDSGEGARASPL